MSLTMPMMVVGSPTRQSSSPQYSALRANTPTSSPNLNKPGGIRKRSATTFTNKTLSTVCPDRLYQAALHIADSKESSAIPAAAGFQWITPQHSPQPDTIFDEPSVLDSFPLWTAPTPPHSDSGLQSALSLDAHDSLISTSGIDLSNEFSFDQPTADMSSSLGFLLPSHQYGSDRENDDYPNDRDYQIPPVRLSQSITSSGTPAHTQTGSSSPSNYASRPDVPASRIGGLPPLSHSLLPSSHPGGPAYSGTASTSRSLFDSSMHPPPQRHYAASYQANQPPPTSQYGGSSASDILHKPAPGEANARAMNSRPKPQCWEHGCNGRQFSTFSNLLRHQREKSGTSSKSYCPKCGAEFTRTTARNGHLAHDKCTKTPRPGGEEK